MKWLCSDCGRDLHDHTIRETQSGHCQWVPPPKINPEAKEKTGVEFNLSIYEQPQMFESFTMERKCDSCGIVWQGAGREVGDIALAFQEWVKGHNCHRSVGP